MLPTWQSIVLSGARNGQAGLGEIMRKLVFAVVVLISLSGGASAQSASEYARTAYTQWACATYWSMSMNPTQERYNQHFLAGLEAARFLYEELNARGKSVDWPEDAPALFIPHMHGPTPDFVAGRLFVVTERHAREKVTHAGWDEVTNTGRTPLPESAWRGSAGIVYVVENCDVLPR
jgi:hypothetical protein